MTSWLETLFTVVISIHLALALAGAGFPKAIGRNRFALELRSQGLLPERLRAVVVRTLPKVEIGTALLLFAGIDLRIGLSLATALFAMFVVYQLVLLALRRDSNCGCHGEPQIADGDRIASITASTINLVLAAAALASYPKGFHYPLAASVMLAAVFTAFAASFLIVPQRRTLMK